MTRYRWIDSQKAAGYPVRIACRVAEVSSSAYYDYCQRRDWGPTEADWDEALVANEIWEVHHRHDDTYGSPRMTGELRRRGYCVNHKRTERLMATLGIYAKDGQKLEFSMITNSGNKIRETFIQVAAPSRTHIKRYHDLLGEVEAEAERINWRFQKDKWKPIVLLNRSHSHEEIEPYYKAADLCLVTSLHDGMNLVAKEFVAARGDEGGVLILSIFTGAARELRDALQVNPYDIDQTAEAIRVALEMELEEKQTRMQQMRRVIRDHNIYHWAGSLITDLCELRLDDEKTDGQTHLGASAA